MAYVRSLGLRKVGSVVGLALVLVWMAACDGGATSGEADAPDTGSAEDTGVLPDTIEREDTGGVGEDLLIAETEADTATPVCDETTCPPSNCLACGDDGQCVSLCDPPGCMTCDGAGQCVRSCAPDEYCDDRGQCVAMCGIGCTCPNEAGYCTASVVDDIRLAPAPREATGEPGCCCDFTGDGVADNALAEMPQVICFVMPCPTFDSLVREVLEDGTLRIMLEYTGLAADDQDTPYFQISLYLGVDTDDDPSNDFSGEATQRIDPGSLDVDGDPLAIFQGASVEDGVLRAGPTQFILPLSLVEGAPDAPLTLDGIAIRANLHTQAGGVALSDGEICGTLQAQSLFGLLNSFVSQSCDCLHLDGPYLAGDGPAPTCGVPTVEPTCDEADAVEKLCGQLHQLCPAAVTATEGLFDVDHDLDGTPDAMSFGLHFSAVPVQIIGVAGSDLD